MVLNNGQPREEGREEGAGAADGGGWPDEIMGGSDDGDGGLGDMGDAHQPHEPELDEDEELLMMQYDDMVRLAPFGLGQTFLATLPHPCGPAAVLLSDSPPRSHLAIKLDLRQLILIKGVGACRMLRWLQPLRICWTPPHPPTLQAQGRPPLGGLQPHCLPLGQGQRLSPSSSSMMRN